MVGLCAAAFAAATMLTIVSAAASDGSCDRSDWPSRFTVATASHGGTLYAYGRGWAELASEQLGIEGSAEVTGGPVENLVLVQSGDAALGLTTLGPARDALDGRNAMTPGVVHDRVRAMFPMYQSPFAIMTLSSSRIASASEIPAGAVVGVGPAGGTSDLYFVQMMDALGTEVSKRNGSVADQAKELVEGRLDAFAFAGGAPLPAFVEAEAQADVNIFGFTNEELDVLTAAFPVSRSTIPAGTYRTVSEDLDVASMWNFAIANANVPECLVYSIVDIAMSQEDAMAQIHEASRETRPENLSENGFIPWHPGAVRWFEEHGYVIPDGLRN